MNEQWVDWKRKVLDPLLVGSPSQADVDEPVVVLSADADRVQRYVFESARLPEVRGASTLLQDLNEGVARIVGETVHPDCVIYAGGGSLLAILPDGLDLLARLRCEIEALYPQHTGVATTTCITYRTTAGELCGGYGTTVLESLNALREFHPSDWPRIAASYEVYDEDGKPPGTISQEAFDSHRGFGQVVKLAGMALRRRKEGRPVASFCEALPHAQRCRSCGLRPADRMARYFGDLWPLCDPCARKLRDWRGLRSLWTEGFEQWMEAQGRELARRYYAAGRPGSLGRPQDIGEIGQACRARSGYVGFIYADGDRIGSLLETCRTPVVYKTVSDALHDATERAVFRGLAELTCSMGVMRTRYNEDGDPEFPPVDTLIHPFEIITVGGDDVLLIVPGDAALPLAVRICDLFGEEMASRLPGGRTVTMSAGVVIAESHNPVRALRDVAEQLLKRSAKRRAHDDQAAAIDFLVLKSQSMLRRDLHDLRATFPVKQPGEGARGALRLTGAPYTTREMRILLELLRRMRRVGFPSSQLHRLVESLHEGRERGSLFFLYQQARHRGRETGAILQEIINTWHFDDASDPIPWNRVERDPDADVGYTSILPDLADLYDFVPAEEHIGQWNVVLGGGE